MFNDDNRLPVSNGQTTEISHYSTRRRFKRPEVDTKTITNNDLLTGSSTKKRKRKSSTIGVKIENSSIDKSREHVKVSRANGAETYSYITRNGLEILPDDCVYLVCEPPSEPYYLGRIMEFTKINQSSTQIDAARINWFYRPRDIQRQNNDSRLVFATMHSDISPLSSVRGKCQISHKSQILDLESYRKQADCFYYDRLFDKFMRRQYEVIPVESVTNVPEKVREVLQQRWKYVIVEVNRSKELAMEHRACKRCNDWCSSKDSVRCAICKSDFHMLCVQPPLPRKPSRGFVWSCTPCSRAALALEDVEPKDASNIPEHTETNEVHSFTTPDEMPRSRLSTKTVASDIILTEYRNPIRVFKSQAASDRGMWPFRYLGIHCNVNDAIDHDDRIYPRAASRIGQRHQATVNDWPGRPVVYFERARRPIKRTAKAMKGKRSDERANLEAATYDSSGENNNLEQLQQEQLKDSMLLPYRESEKKNGVSSASMTFAERPPWLQEKPINYISRGEGLTSECLWSPPTEFSDGLHMDYLKETKSIAKHLNVDWRTSNFLDAALQALYKNQYDIASAVKSLNCLTRAAIAEPTFCDDEIRRFAQSVTKNGSELAQVAQDVGTQSVASCVRFYYLWKKSPKGSRVWASSEARKPKMDLPSQARPTNIDDLGQSSDDSAYNSAKALKKKKYFRCKFCSTDNSRQWRRAPGTTHDKNLIIALCDRCATLWRKYAVTWESPEDVFKKRHEGPYKSRKKHIEEELIKELPIDGSKPETHDELVESTKINKKSKRSEKQKEPTNLVSTLPTCDICQGTNQVGFAACDRCGLKVHRACYGLYNSPDISRVWICDPCENDISPHASTDYGCVLCPIRPDRDSNCVGSVRRTAANNWAHVLCATWMPCLQFESVNNIPSIQGIPVISLRHWEEVCIVCATNDGACLHCTACGVALHVSCAQSAGHVLGFDIQPIKSSQSRRDSLVLIRLGLEAGLMTPVVYCHDHDVSKLSIHAPHEVSADTGVSAISLYNKTYKHIGEQQIGISRGQRSSDWHIHDGLSRILQLKSEERHRDRADRVQVNIQEDNIQHRRCIRCEIEFSPCFYSKASRGGNNDGSFVANVEADIPAKICHRCFWSEHYSKESAVQRQATSVIQA